MYILKKYKHAIFILLLILIGGIFRFYNLNWGSPFYFHPDERNIASSAIQLNFPSQMNPNFFAYGSLPIYLIYFTSLILNLFLKSQNLFPQLIFTGRFYSSILSLLIIPSVYFIGKKNYGREVGFLAATLSTFSVGFIQFSHFGTFEIWLTFLGIWLFYFSLKLAGNLNFKNIIVVGIIFGLLAAVKISSLPFLILPLVAVGLNLLSKIKKLNAYFLLLNSFLKILILFFVSLIIFTILSPYALLDFDSFLSSVRYESSVALGVLPVFYTGEFINSIPVVFQFTKIYPFLIDPILTILFPLSFIYISIIGIKKKNYSYLMLNTCYLIFFLPQAFLFAKWTRYMIPTLPFVYLIIALAIENFFRKNFLDIKRLILWLLILVSIIFSVSYFITVLAKPDTRIAASLWAKENISNESVVLSEAYDMGIVPFNQYLKNIALFNFYDLDRFTKINPSGLENALAKSEYIILPSQRILKTRMLNKDSFPEGNEFYISLLSQTLNFKKIYETPCDIFCKITYMGNPVFSFEQTATVFDRPTVFIFKKNEN